MFVRRNCMSRFWNRSSKRSSASGPAAEGVAADDEDAFPTDEPEGFLTEEPGRNTAVFSEMGRAGASAASYGRTYCSIGTDVDADARRRRNEWGWLSSTPWPTCLKSKWKSERTWK
jgi:hypothetical protein